MYNIITVKDYLTSLSKRREKMNEDMTNEEIKIFLKMILQIVKDSKDKEDIIKKLEELLKK